MRYDKHLTAVNQLFDLGKMLVHPPKNRQIKIWYFDTPFCRRHPAHIADTSDYLKNTIWNSQDSVPKIFIQQAVCVEVSAFLSCTGFPFITHRDICVSKVTCCNIIIQNVKTVVSLPLEHEMPQSHSNVFQMFQYLHKRSDCKFSKDNSGRRYVRIKTIRPTASQITFTRYKYPKVRSKLWQYRSNLNKANKSFIFSRILKKKRKRLFRRYKNKWLRMSSEKKVFVYGKDDRMQISPPLLQ